MMRRSPIPAFLVLAMALAGTASAQAVLTLRPVPESRMFVDGTSNSSDWTVEAQVVTGRFSVVGSADGIVVSEAEVHVPSNSIKSDRGIIMDRLMRGALKVSQFKDISFVMSAPATGVKADSGFAVTAPGTLTVAGASREIELEVFARPGPDGQWRFTGSHGVAMTDYGMRPPTAMFGALVTGNDVVIRFDVVAAQEAAGADSGQDD
jgi:polyisoprenoid-binding protein YceI